MSLETSTITTPIGPLTLVASDGVLRAASFTDRPDEVHARMGPDAREQELRRTGDLGPIADALRAYFDGEVHAIENLPVEQAGNTWFQSAWKVMREVPAGSSISYRELAARVSDPSNARAAGFACARNQVVLVVPCHRIVRTDGSLGDYYYGLDVKRWLLRHEGMDDLGLPFEGDPPKAMASAEARQAARTRRHAGH
ncbi:MAG TPA: methylated-DNA--[protein]-cysteine S-methyltransferase [Actinomycetes bacterium]|jgi:methylated-DNA-[protein]-cysteine S-methyltransferase|nr:methylated-DNA--[protein]-cysteine S-methyltransferase [Actinomycetes bacterium]